MTRLTSLLAILTVALLLAACPPFLPERAPREMQPQEGTFELREFTDDWQFVLTVAEPAERVVLFLSAPGLATENPDCDVDSQIGDATLIRCAVPGVVETGFVVTVTADVRPFGTGSLFFEADRTQPILFQVE